MIGWRLRYSGVHWPGISLIGVEQPASRKPRSPSEWVPVRGRSHGSSLVRTPGYRPSAATRRPSGLPSRGRSTRRQRRRGRPVRRPAGRGRCALLQQPDPASWTPYPGPTMGNTGFGRGRRISWPDSARRTIASKSVSPARRQGLTSSSASATSCFTKARSNSASPTSGVPFPASATTRSAWCSLS